MRLFLLATFALLMVLLEAAGADSASLITQRPAHLHDSPSKDGADVAILPVGTAVTRMGSESTKGYWNVQTQDVA
ncbi:MAG TPA: hypothetical protein VHE81_00785, partial [Lacipirellulaceae bacterium]|nr:hypothetical protein [Lacipirellulaceae bacterium]